MVTNGLDGWSIGTLLQMVHPRPAGGFISVELVAAAAAASIFVMDCPPLHWACASMDRRAPRPPGHRRGLQTGHV